eukprot:403355323
MDPLFQSMREENENLIKALAFLEKQLEITLIEKDQINALHLDFKAHYEQMISQNNDFKKRLGEEHQARRDLEITHEQRVSDMKRTIDARQRDIEQMQAKMSLPIDSDIMRMKIQKDIEGRHRIELDQKQQDNERLSEQYYEMKRQVEILKTQLDSNRHEHEKEVIDMKDKHKQEIHEMMLENQALQSRADDKRDRELIRQLRRDLDENKRRITEMLTDSSDLRRERDLAKLEKNELVIQYTKDLEEERNQKRQIQSELDRVAFKLNCVEEEKQKLMLKVEKKQGEISNTHLEKNKLDSVLREKDALIDTICKQVTQLKEDLRQSDMQQQHLVKRLQEEEKEFHIRERKDKSKLQKEIEVLQRQILDIESTKRSDLEKAQSEFERIQREYRIVQEEKRMSLAKLQEVQVEYEAYRRQFEQKRIEQEQYESELKKLQEKYREAMSQLYSLKNDKDHLERSLQVAQQEVNRFNEGFDQEISIRNKERAEMQVRIQELITQNEKQRIETSRQIESYKSKYHQYKNKLKQANNSLQTLAERVAKYEMYMAAERENNGGIGSGEAGLGSTMKNLVGGGSISQQKLSQNRRSQVTAHAHYSSQGLMSDYAGVDEFNINDMQNDKMNEEIKKLLEENKRALNQ